MKKYVTQFGEKGGKDGGGGVKESFHDVMGTLASRGWCTGVANVGGGGSLGGDGYASEDMSTKSTLS